MMPEINTNASTDTSSDSSQSTEKSSSRVLGPGTQAQKSAETIEAEKRSLVIFKKKYTLIRKIAQGGEGTAFTCIPTRAARLLKRSGEPLENSNLKVAKFAYKEGPRATKEIVATRHLPPFDNFVPMEDYDHRENMWLITPLMTGQTLYHLRANCHFDNEPMSGSLFWHIFTELVKGVEKLHDEGITHYDLISRNVFVDPNDKSYRDYPRIKVGDFGRVKWNDFAARKQPSEYMAEARKQKVYRKGDVWHIAAIMYSIRYTMVETNEHDLYYEDDRAIEFGKGGYYPPRGKKIGKWTKPIYLEEDEEALFQKLMSLCNLGHRSIAAWREHGILKDAENLRESRYQPPSRRMRLSFERMSAASCHWGPLGGQCKAEVVQALENPSRYPNPFEGNPFLEPDVFLREWRDAKPQVKPKRHWPTARRPTSWANFLGKLTSGSSLVAQSDSSSTGSSSSSK